MNEVENVLQIQSYAYNWPIGSGKEFKGVVDREKKECIFFEKTSIGGAQKADMIRKPLAEAGSAIVEELDLLDLAGAMHFIGKSFLQGLVTPVFFASALTNFGVEPFFDAFINLAPALMEDLANKAMERKWRSIR